MEEVLRTADPVRVSWAIESLADNGIEVVTRDSNYLIIEGGDVVIPCRVLNASGGASRIKTYDPLKQP